ncbi:hypothetical protein BDZ89DRAFT_1065648 [Hymenopellis radicata]|nr:hypothetical protein BDZ89DRAFT_1065648 [Hymenopellis radicata]
MSVARDDYHDFAVNAYLSLVSFTILYYDWIITFGLEVERIWLHRDFSVGVLGFYINRYVGIFGHAVIIVEYFWTGFPPNKEAVCHQMQRFHQYFALFVQLVVATMLIMRTYALYERSRKVLFLQVSVAFAVVAIGCYSIISGKKTALVHLVLPYVGCPAGLSKDAAYRLGAAWTGMLVFDVLVFYLTLRKALILNRRGGVNLLTVLLRDGSVYFGVMVMANIANILTFFLADVYLRGCGTTFTNVIASTMVSRLMLNLRDPKLARTPLSTSISNAHFTTLNPRWTTMPTRPTVNRMGAVTEEQHDEYGIELIERTRRP